MTTEQMPRERTRGRWHRRTLGNARDGFLLKNYRLDKSERAHLMTAGAILSQVAVPVASAIYFLLTQVYYQVRYGNTVTTLLGLRDTWNRFPVHVENLLGAHWFPGQAAPSWWVVARHDFRHVLIGLLVVLMVGAITIGLKSRKRASTAHMIFSVPLAFLVAALTAAPLIALDAHIRRVGVDSGNPWVSEWVGKGNIQLVLIGVIAAFPARKVLARTMDTIQLFSLEKKMRAGETEQWWWRFVYLPNYVKRWRVLNAEGHVPPAPKERGKVMSVLAAFMVKVRDVMTVLAVPVLLFLLGFGVWLLYWGPAVGAH